MEGEENRYAICGSIRFFFQDDIGDLLSQFINSVSKSCYSQNLEPVPHWVFGFQEKTPLWQHFLPPVSIFESLC